MQTYSTLGVPADAVSVNEVLVLPDTSTAGGLAPKDSASMQSGPTAGVWRPLITKAARRPSGGVKRRVRVAEGVYQRIDRKTGKPVAAKFEFVYRDATGRQV